MTPQPGAIVRVPEHPGLIGLVTTLGESGLMDDWEWLRDPSYENMTGGDQCTIVALHPSASERHSTGCVYNVGADHLDVVGQLEGVECE